MKNFRLARRAAGRPPAVRTRVRAPTGARGGRTPRRAASRQRSPHGTNSSPPSSRIFPGVNHCEIREISFPFPPGHCYHEGAVVCSEGGKMGTPFQATDPEMAESADKTKVPAAPPPSTDVPLPQLTPRQPPVEELDQWVA